MTGRDFFPLAAQLAAGTTEAEWRTSVSRAYYAAFHHARELLTALGFVVPRDEKAHPYLYLRLNNCGLAHVQKAASDLHALRRRRNQGDYDLQMILISKFATDELPVAQGFIQTLDNLTPTERTQIRDAMIIYERDVLQNVTWHP
jgi:uncharacterized protein (UPF0332 family)